MRIAENSHVSLEEVLGLREHSLQTDSGALRAQQRRERRIGVLATAAFLSIVVLLAAVASAPPPSAPLVVAIGPWLGYDPLVLLREQERLPTTIRVVELPSATDTLGALSDGRVEAAAVTLDEALRLRRRLPDLRVIAVLSESRGADGVVLRAGVEGPRGLDGRRILVEDSAVGGLMLAAALKAEGLRPDQVRPVQVRAQHLARRWADADIDAVVSYEPLLSRLVGEGHTLLHSTRELSGLVYDVLVARETVIEARARELQALLQAWDQTVPAFDAGDALPLQLLVPGTGLSDDEYRRALQGIDFLDGRRSQALLSGSDIALQGVMPQLSELLGLDPAAGMPSLHSGLLLPGLQATPARAQDRGR